MGKKQSLYKLHSIQSGPHLQSLYCYYPTAPPFFSAGNPRLRRFSPFEVRERQNRTLLETYELRSEGTSQNGSGAGIRRAPHRHFSFPRSGKRVDGFCNRDSHAWGQACKLALGREGTGGRPIGVVLIPEILGNANTQDKKHTFLRVCKTALLGVAGRRRMCGRAQYIIPNIGLGCPGGETLANIS